MQSHLGGLPLKRVKLQVRQKLYSSMHVKHFEEQAILKIKNIRF